MDCAHLEVRLRQGEALAGADVDAHLRSCEACAALVEDRGGLARALDGARASAATADLAGLERDIVARVGAERGLFARVRAWPRAARLALVVGLVILDIVFFHTFLLRGDFDTFPRARLLVMDGVYAALLLAAMWTALRPLYLRPPPAWVPRALLIAGMVAPFVFALVPGLPPFTGHVKYVAYTYYCFMTGAGQGLALLLLARLLDRGGRSASAEALLVVVAGGVLGQIGLSIECPVNDPIHLLTGHATVPVGMLLGMLFLRRAETA